MTVDAIDLDLVPKKYEPGITLRTFFSILAFDFLISGQLGKGHNMENISVSVRVRPLSKSESQDAWRIDGSTISQSLDRSDVKYTLDHVFGPSATTLQIYDQTARPLIAKVVKHIEE